MGKSGQEDGGSDERSPCSDDDADDEAASGSGILGGLEGRSARALDNRAAFLYGKPSYILYFWEGADQHQLLQLSLQRLDRAVGASDASNAPIIHTTRRRRGHVDDDASSGHRLRISLIPNVGRIRFHCPVLCSEDK